MSEAFDVRIITASYRREPVDGPEEPQVPVIQLFGRMDFIHLLHLLARIGAGFTEIRFGCTLVFAEDG